MVVADGQDIHDEFHNAARGEILSEAAAKEGIHKGFKGATFAIKVGFAQVYVLQVADDGAHALGREADIVFKYFGIFQTALFIKTGNALE